jgi:exodeoxyribonuclease V beta subunit
MPAAAHPPLFGRVRSDSTTKTRSTDRRPAQQRGQLRQLKAPWAQWADELRQICRDAVAAKQVDGRKMQARYFEPWFDKLKAWAATIKPWSSTWAPASPA